MLSTLMSCLTLRCFGEARLSAAVRRAYVGSGPCNCSGRCNLAALEDGVFHLVPVYPLQALQTLRTVTALKGTTLRTQTKASNKSLGKRLELIKMRSASMPPSAPVKRASNGRWLSFSSQRCLWPMLRPGQSAPQLFRICRFSS